MKLRPSFLILAVSSLALFSCATNQRELPPLSSVGRGIAAEGTLADHVLAKDASLAVRKIMGGNARVLKFVVQKPVGPAGSKAWREIWVYDPDGIAQKLIMTFREDGEGSADFAIQKM